MLVAAGRRFTLLLFGFASSTALLALAVGLALGSSVGRSLSLGWYCVGCALLLGGFFVGNRGPSRPVGEGWSLFSLRRYTRWATRDEQHESISLSAILIVLGVILIVLGAAADTRYSLI